MSNFEDQRDETRNVEGMRRMLMHAFDMNQNGQLEAKELDELRRWMVGQTIDRLSMDDYVAARKSGRFDEVNRDAGQDPNDPEELPPHELQKSRDAIAQKVIADYLGQAWAAGTVDDETYTALMAQFKGTDLKNENDLDPGEHAAKVWMKSLGLEEEPPPPESTVNELEVGDDDTEEFNLRAARAAKKREEAHRERQSR